MFAFSHRGNRDWGVQEKWRCNNDGFDIGVSNRFTVVLVDFDVVFGFAFVFPAIDRHQTRAGFEGVRGGPVAVEGTVNTGRANVADGFDFDEGGIDGSHQYIAFVTCSDNTYANGTVGFAVAIQHAGDTCPRDTCGC